MAFYSPLRYPGGKRKLASFFYTTFDENDLHNGTYVEPFAGGASIALSLLFNEYVSNIIINDIDRSIYAFWYSVLFNNKKLCNLILETKINQNVWKKCKTLQKQKERTDLLNLGFSTFFLNRTNHSGIINGGMIGGRKQLGKWKIDARFNRKELVDRISCIGEYRDRISLYNMDAYDLVKRLNPYLSKRTLFYFDPPYYEKGKKLYENYYKTDDHIKMADEIRSINFAKWIVSYDNKFEVKKMYEDCRSFKYCLNYSAANVRSGKEIIFFSKNLSVTDNMLSCLKKI